MSNNLVTNILLNAQIGSGIYQVGSTLTELGSIVDGLSQRIIDFGEESIEVFRDYQMNMRDAEVALSTSYGQGTQELQKVMSQLDAYATDWAATTIFHTNDVANAISEAAHAGWDYDQIMAGIPAAMRLAQAGSLDLSEAVNYIVKSTNAAGIGFEDMDHWIDLWTFAANSSASTIGEFGDSMLRMGSTMRFASDPEELMTLIAVTADAGSVGSEAGTMVRNSIMRLIAPTQKAQEAMELLGATSDEVSEVMNDEALAAANAALASHGFTVFDQETGEMRPILDIYGDLSDCLAEIAGGYENISSNEDALSILSAIFPTRTITEALNLLNATRESYGGLYDAMKDGAAEGYGEYAAETMMDSLGGDIEIFESKVERLKQVVGGGLSDDVSGVLDFLGGVVDSLAEMDEDKLDVLITGAEALAVAGPGLIAAGGAFRMLGLIASPMGAVTAAMVAAPAFAAAMTKIADLDFESNFGNMELDTGPILDYIHGLGDGFRDAYEDIDTFHTAMDQAVESYQNASSEFSSTLLTNMLTGAQLTEPDKEKLQGLGDEMFNAVKDGIHSHYSESANFWNMLFGGEGTAENDPAYQGIIDKTNSAYTNAIAEAETIGNDMRAAMNAAFKDGTVSKDEYDNILSYVKSYNAALARATSEAADEETRIRYRVALNKGQTASFDELEGIASSLAEQRDANLAQLQEDYDWNYAEAQINGATEAELAEADEKYRDRRMEEETNYTDFLVSLYGSNIQQSDQLGDAYDAIGAAADAWISGEMDRDTALDFMKGQTSRGDRKDVGTALQSWLEMAGGADAVEEQIAFLRESGQNDIAGELARIYAIEEMANGFHRGAENIVEYGDSGTVGMQAAESRAASVEAAVRGVTPIMPYMGGGDAGAILENQGVEVDVYGDTEELTATIDAEDGQTLLEYVDGDATDLEMKITDQDGRVLHERVTGDASQLEQILNSYSGRVVTVNIRGRQLFAEGGRATSPSIFGEAGPEWAIPEEHSDRTAALLDAARAASGFTWPDLLARFGGLNANAGYTPTTVVYSPVINAEDVTGVKTALQEDHARFERWWNEKQMREAVEVYQ